MTTETALPPVSTIWKYPLVSHGVISINMPQGAEVLSAQMQLGFVTLWALVGPRTVYEMRTFLVVGTGNALPPANLSHISTILDGPYVWHVFEMH